MREGAAFVFLGGFPFSLLRLLPQVFSCEDPGDALWEFSLMELAAIHGWRMLRRFLCIMLILKRKKLYPMPRILEDATGRIRGELVYLFGIMCLCSPLGGILLCCCGIVLRPVCFGVWIKKSPLC